MMKVVSFCFEGQVYILGTPDGEIAEFEDDGGITLLFQLGMSSRLKSGYADRVRDSFSFILNSDPRIHDIEDVMDLLETDVISHPTTMMMISSDEIPDAPVVSIFRADAEQSTTWHQSGLPFDYGKKIPKVSESFLNLIRKAAPSENYISPRMSDIEKWRICDCDPQQIH